MRNISAKIWKEGQNTHLCSITFFEDRAVYEIMWKNIVESGRRQMTIWNIRIAYWIPKATNTYSEYVTLIDFLLQQRLHECAPPLPMLCFTIVPPSVRTTVFRVVFPNLNLSNREQIWNIHLLLSVCALCFLFSENSTL